MFVCFKIGINFSRSCDPKPYPSANIKSGWEKMSEKTNQQLRFLTVTVPENLRPLNELYSDYFYATTEFHKPLVVSIGPGSGSFHFATAIKNFN